jgi:YHS domain-containing protein
MPTDRRAFLGLAATALAATAVLAVDARADEIFTNTWGSAIRGYDPVAYFTEGRPVEGVSEHTLEWKGATWYFASADNLEAFRAEPERFAPQYGGYCAWAVSQGYTASIDPEAWDIVDGKLYLNYNRSVQETWQGDRSGFIALADGAWPGLQRDLAGR